MAGHVGRDSALSGALGPIMTSNGLYVDSLCPSERVLHLPAKRIVTVASDCNEP
jgi:hypothetical protein